MARRSGSLERLGALIHREKKLRPPGAVEASPVAFREWEAAVGTRIAARARPMKLDRGVLYVQAASSTWAQELSLLGDTIAEQLRTRGLTVRSLRFRVGKVDPIERPPWRDDVRPEPPEVPLPPDVLRELGRVLDPELRKAIARAAAKNLGWQAAEASAGPRPTVATAKRPEPPRAPAAPTSPAGRPKRAAGAVEKPGPSPAISPRRAARDPQGAASGTARSGRTKEPSGGDPRGTS
jgi:hypothetical protein